MIPPIPYRGEKSYIFISYAHKDSDRVWAIIKQMQHDGYRVWYDEGIDPGTEWDENIASHVRDCGYFIAFVSENYLKSDNCKDELNFARDLEKKQVLVYLEDVELPPGMALRSGRFQNFRADKRGFFSRLYEAEGISEFTEEASFKNGKNKKLLSVILGSLLLVVILLFCLGGFLKKSQSQQGVSEYIETEVEDDPSVLKQTTFLSSKTGVKLTAQEFYFDEDGKLRLIVQAENTSDQDVSLWSAGVYLNGMRCDAAYLEVSANTTETSEFWWNADMLEEGGLGEIRDVTDITVIEGAYMANREGNATDYEHFIYYPYGESNAKSFTYTPDDDDVVLVDRADCQVIFTDHFLNEDGDWVGEFVFENLSDRHLSVTLSLEQTNGYVYGENELEYIRPGQAVCDRIVLDEWQVTEQDTVRLLEGYVHLSDTDTQKWIDQKIPITIYPEGDTDLTFPLRELEADDKILLENEYIRLALIEEYEESSEHYVWTVYCVNLSEKNIKVQMVNVKENGEDWYDWYIGGLEPGQQCFATEGCYHNGERNTEVLTGDLVVMEKEYNKELSRDCLELEFSW